MATTPTKYEIVSLHTKHPPCNGTLHADVHREDDGSRWVWITGLGCSRPYFVADDRSAVENLLAEHGAALGSMVPAPIVGLPQLGDKLANGSTVIATRTSDRGTTYVLCQWGREYVSWIINRQWHTDAGHYRKTLGDAVGDWETRL